jgi:hypothetical protein
MRAAPVLLAASLVTASLPADAADLELGWTGRGVWTSNVFRTTTNEEDAFSVYTGPDIAIYQTRGDVQYNLEYRPRYEAFVDLDDANATEHFANADLAWTINPLTQVAFHNSFARSVGLRGVFDPLGPDPDAGEILVDRESILRNLATGSFSRWLSQRNQLVVNVSHYYFDYEEEERPDSQNFRGAVNLRRTLSRRQTAGIGFAVSRLDNEETSFQEDRGTTYLETYAIYELLVSRTLRFSLAAGPTWILPDDFADERAQLQYAVTRQTIFINGARFQFPVLASRAACTGDLASSCATPAPIIDLTTNAPPILPPTLQLPIVDVPYQDGAPSADSSLTLFGSASLIYDRPPYRGVLSYTRRASNSGGLGGSTNLDIATAALVWEPDRRWHFMARTSWSRQTSATEFPIAGGVVDPAGEDLLLDEAGRIVTDPAAARYSIPGVARIGAVRTVDFLDDAVDVTAYRVELRASHRLTRRFTVDAIGSYWYQTSGADERVDADRQSFRFELGFSWSLDPISL